VGDPASRKPADAEEESTDQPFRPVLVAVLAAGLALVVALLVIESRGQATSTVPDLEGIAVDPVMDNVAFRLEAVDLVLGEVTQATCPRFALPGTVIAQHPRAAKLVAPGTPVDVTVCRSIPSAR
jgi:hypothetical protein